jgi:hypothetical protein
MRNDIWVMAAYMVREHGADAPSAVHAKLVAMENDRAGEQQFGLWFQIGLAVLDLLRERERHGAPSGTTQDRREAPCTRAVPPPRDVRACPVERSGRSSARRRIISKASDAANFAEPL